MTPRWFAVLLATVVALLSLDFVMATTSDSANSTSASPSADESSGYLDCVADSVGDGDCDVANNSEACSYDGGDCCSCTCTKGSFECGASGFDCQDPDATCFGTTSEADESAGDGAIGDDAIDQDTAEEAADSSAAARGKSGVPVTLAAVSAGGLLATVGNVLLCG